MAERGRYLFAVDPRPRRAATWRTSPGCATPPLESSSTDGLQAVGRAAWTSTSSARRALRAQPRGPGLAGARWPARHDDVVQAVAARGHRGADAAGHDLPRRRRGAQTGSTEWHDGARRPPWTGWRAAASGASRRTPPSGRDEPATTQPAATAARRAGAAYLQRKRAQADRRPRCRGERAPGRRRDPRTRWLDRGGRAPAARRAGPAADRPPEGTMIAQRRLPRRGPTAPTRSRPAADGRGRRTRDVRLEVHGPWPPYSFATLD